MNKILRYILFLTACIAANSVFAQSVTARETLAVDYFFHSPEVPFGYVQAIRSRVLNAFIERGRHDVLDATHVKELLYANPDLVADLREEAGRDWGWTDARIAVFGSLGVKYLISGSVVHYIFKRTGKDEFNVTFVVMLGGYELETGRNLPVREIELTGKGTSASEADKKAIAGIRPQLETYIDKYFKFTTEILELGADNGKGKLKELYIRSGSGIGVHPGDLFMVYSETEMSGETVREKVGKLRAKEVKGENVTRCVVVNGGDDIVDAINAGRRIVVVSDSESLFSGGWNDAGNAYR